MAKANEKRLKQDDVGAPRIALQDFVLCHNEYFFDIKRGDDLDVLGVPVFFNMNLRTEKVI